MRRKREHESRGGPPRACVLVFWCKGGKREKEREEEERKVRAFLCSSSQFLLRRLFCSLFTLQPPEFRLPFPQWLLPSASRLPQVRACRCCLDEGNARGAVAPGRRRSIGSLELFFFWLCSLLLLLFSCSLALSGNFSPWRAKVDSLLLSFFPPRDRTRGALLPLPRLAAPRAPPSRR